MIVDRSSKITKLRFFPLSHSYPKRVLLFTIEVATRPSAPYKMYQVRFRAYSSHLPFEMLYVRSSLHAFAPTGEQPRPFTMCSVTVCSQVSRIKNAALTDWPNREFMQAERSGNFLSRVFGEATQEKKSFYYCLNTDFIPCYFSNEPCKFETQSQIAVTLCSTHILLAPINTL